MSGGPGAIVSWIGFSIKYIGNSECPGLMTLRTPENV